VTAPVFSILTPVYDTPAAILRACVRSVRRQRFRDWELCLVDDGSGAAHVAPLLDQLARTDPRLRVGRRTSNGGIVAASNDALAMARGTWIVLLDHDDVLEPDALTSMASAIERHPLADYLYSDEDVLSTWGDHVNPFYKPDWSPERLRSQHYTTHLSVLRRSLVEEVGGFRAGFEGAQDHDLVLRVTERAREVHHVPRALYHWRSVETSVAGRVDAKPYAYEAGRRAVQEHCDRSGIAATVEHGPTPGVYRVRRQVHGEPLVSVIIPTRGSVGRVWGARRTFVVEAVRSLLHGATYENFELVVVADRDTPDHVVRRLRSLAGDRLRLEWFDEPFNFSVKVNRGAAVARGEHLLLLNDDVEVVTPDFVETMLGFAQDADVGMVGAKLLFADGRLQHGGHVYTADGPHHIFFGWPGDHEGPGRLLLVARECSGVTAACALVPASVFQEVGGMTPLLPANFNDVDLSLKIRETGRRIVWTPDAVLYHFESQSRVPTVTAEEMDVMMSRWSTQLAHDPYHNPNLEPGQGWWLERPFR